jgi:hypothetical protein
MPCAALALVSVNGRNLQGFHFLFCIAPGQKGRRRKIKRRLASIHIIHAKRREGKERKNEKMIKNQ